MKNCVVRPFGFAQDRRAHHILSLWFDLLTTMSGVEWSKDGADQSGRAKVQTLRTRIQEWRIAKGENNSQSAIRYSQFCSSSPRPSRGRGIGAGARIWPR